MKKFTLKDFILYNGPCFSCGDKVAINMVHSDAKGEFKKLPQSLKDGVLDVTLRIKYSFTLNLQVQVDNNKFMVSDLNKFITYLTVKDLYMVSNCKKCKGFIYSNPLQFDSRMFVNPITILREVLSTIDNDVYYTLISEYSENETQINVLDKKIDKLMQLTIPLLPLYRFKTKEKLVNKLKTYILFS